MSPVPPHAGSHHLESSFGAVAAPTKASERAPRRKRTGVILTVVGVLVVGAACAGVQWAANLGYDDALIAFEDTVDEAESGQSQLAGALTILTETTDAAAIVIDADSGTLMDSAAKDAFASGVEAAMDAETAASPLIEEELPEAADKQSWAWELFGQTAQLNTYRDDAEEKLEEFDSTAATITEKSDAVQETGTAAVLSAAEAAGSFEAAHVSARNVDILSLRDAAEHLSGSTTLDAPTADVYARLETSAAAMLASEQAELAEKQGPLYDSRIQIEAFARELAPGVLLDFDWSPLVNGYGEADSMGGYATWWYADPGYATIELSNSVAQYWPGDRSKALVAHEVGHAISVKCEGMYDDSTQENIEAWATAWAISMGFHDPANGTSAYGAPPQSMIDAAAGCR